jgi:prespore-specific regulator
MKLRQDAWSEENDLLLAETVLRHVREGSTQLNAFEEVGDKLNRTSAACGFRWNAVVRHQYEKALQLAKKQRKQRHRLLGKDQGGKKKLLYQPPTPSMEDLDAMSLSLEEAQEEMEFQQLQSFGYYPNTEKEKEAEPTDNPTSEGENETVSKEETQEKQPVAPSLASYTTTTRGEITLEKVIAFLQNFASSNIHSDILKSENQRLKHEITEIRRTNSELEKKVSQLEKNSVTMQEDYETLMQIMNRARKLVLFDEEEGKAPRFKMDRNGNLEKVAE